MAGLIKRREGQMTRAPDVWDPFRRMSELLSMNWPFMREFEGGMPEVSAAGFYPAFEVKETKDGFVFKADLPGVKEEDLDISLSGDRLTISGKRESEKRDEGDTYYAYECQYGAFSRSFTLPEGVNPDDIHADMKDGVLSVHLSKRPEVQPKKISVGSTKKVKA